MNTVTVTASGTYDVLIGHGILPELGGHIKTLLPPTQKIAVVTDETVAALYAKPVLATLTNAGLTPHIYTLTPGETSKNSTVYLSLLNRLAEDGFTRADCIVALGGGVVGDLAGFTAATFLRGIPYIQVPTTLLAMVDSSVGGKTAIDLPHGKNLAGAFYQPTLVLIDTDTLDTLPQEIFQDGMAEVIKYGMLNSPRLLDQLLNDNITQELPTIITTCVSIKRDVVEQDEFDTGRRMLLNLGHTVGHAIEKLSNYTIPHGQAVAIGMTIDTRAAVAKHLCPPDCLHMLDNLLDRYSLPNRTDYSAEAIFQAAQGDKKRRGGDISIVTPRSLGHSELMQIPVEDLLHWIKLGVSS
ncbi:MAG: 3-dehydroquinate synthase [Oscillospiraceae bacterium]|nr:3-dehydroquinate synthase [Oscillospiraceae bacterium]